MEEAIVTTSWDDGHPLDLKLAELLKRYDIPATFYLPIANVERPSMNPQQIREIAGSFDVGGHGYRHLNLVALPLSEAEREIVEGKKSLDDIIGRECVSFAYPKGAFDDEVISLVRNAGFIGARTVRALTRRINEPFKVGTTVLAADWWFAPYVKHSLASKDPRLFSFMLGNGLFFRGWDEIAMRALDFIVENGGVWHLYGHSWEIEARNEWGKLDRVLSRAGVLSNRAVKVNNSELLKACGHGR